MEQIKLKDRFTEDFFEEFQYDPLFRSVFNALRMGASPYRVIENLCKGMKETTNTLREVIENTPKKVIVTTEAFERLKKEAEK